MSADPVVLDATPPAPIRELRLARRRRAIKVNGAVLLVGFGCVVALFGLGDAKIPPDQVIVSLLRLGDDPAVDFVVQDLRQPVVVGAIGVGLALGMAGAVFQKLLANPLASPDFVGISTGASMFAIFSIVFLGFGGFAVSAAALAGAFVTGALIYVLAWRGGIQGYRFILTGIGVTQFGLALIGYVLASSQIFEAQEAMTWLVGSVGAGGDVELRVLWIGLAVLVPLGMVLSRPLRALELGDDAACALGARVELARFGLLAISVILVGLAVAAAGPISFVALAAAPIAARLLGPAGGVIITAALVGAVMVLAGQLAAEHVLPGSLPTGVISGAVGAPYLLYLLVSVNRQGRGG